ncbi:hypothetical protein D3C71_1407550 [compost metagenome]
MRSPSRRSRKSASTALAAVRRSTMRPPSCMSGSSMLPDRSTANIICRASRGGSTGSPSCCGRAAAAHRNTQASHSSIALNHAPPRPFATCNWSRAGSYGTRNAGAFSSRNGHQRISTGKGNSSHNQGQANAGHHAGSMSSNACISASPPSIQESVCVPIDMRAQRFLHPSAGGNRLPAAHDPRRC